MENQNNTFEITTSQGIIKVVIQDYGFLAKEEHGCNTRATLMISSNFFQNQKFDYFLHRNEENRFFVPFDFSNILTPVLKNEYNDFLLNLNEEIKRKLSLIGLGVSETSLEKWKDNI